MALYRDDFKGDLVGEVFSGENFDGDPVFAIVFLTLGVVSIAGGQQNDL